MTSTRAVPNEICIVMLTALGDAVHVLPVVNAIKRQSPRSRITWILQPTAAELVREHPAVDEIIVFERSKGVRAFLEMRRVLARREFDVVLLLQPFLKAAIIASMARANVKVGTDRARAKDLSSLATPVRLPSRSLAHMQDQFLEFLDFLGVEREPLEWRLGPFTPEVQKQREFFARFNRPVASIVVGTTKADKDWPAERWAAVADALHEQYGMQVVLVGGNSDRERAAESTILRVARHKPFSAVGSGGVRDLVSILAGSALVLSPDTGPLHMAVALDRPVISLIGYSDPRRTGPYRKFQDLVIDAFHDDGEAGPVTDARRRGRMPRITVVQVLAKVALWKQRYTRS